MAGFKEDGWKELGQIYCWLCLNLLLFCRRFLLSFAGLQLAFLILVLLKKDILHWVLPPGLASALGSHPPRPFLF